MSAGRVDWFYRRKGCRDCERAQALISEHGLEIKTVVDVDKVRFSGSRLIALAREAERLLSAAEGGVTELDLRRSPPSDEELQRLLMGAEGGLRVPAVRIGRTLLVGFDEAMYRTALARGGGA